jgi:aminoglycoside phosphotransferase (APT) family kinase protein
MCGALIDTLADLHEINLSDAHLSDFGKPEGYVRRQIEGWTKRYRDAQTDQLLEMETTAEWLASRIPPESGTSLIHNDFKFDNVGFDLTSPVKVATIFDWEMATIGDPLMDLGTSLGYWVEASEIAQLSASFVGPTWLPGALTRKELVER